MNNNQIVVSSSNFEIAEENDLYISMTNLICYYDDSNLNGVILPYSGCEDKATEISQTMISMPVQARLKTNFLGKTDFGGHEMKVDSEGNVVFGTQSIGVHTKTWIAIVETNVKGVTKEMPCLFAECRVWKRYPKVVETIKQLFTDGKLTSSWELQNNASYINEKGEKVITDYAFLGNTLLGSSVCPSYSNARPLMVASTEEHDDISKALSQDIYESLNIATKNQDKEETILEGQELETKIVSEVKNSEVEEVVSTETEVVKSEVKDETTINESVVEDENKDVVEPDTNEEDDDKAETSEAITEKKDTELASLTQWDVIQKIEQLAYEKLNDWCYVAWFFPLDKTVWVKQCCTPDLDYVKFTYDNVGDIITLSEPQDVKLTVQISEIDSKIAELENELAERNETIVSQNSKITELSEIKSKWDLVQAEKQEEELAKKKTELSEYALRSKEITSKELEDGELKIFIDNLDKASIDAVIAERVIKKNNIKETEISEKRTIPVVTFASSNLNNEDVYDKVDIMREFFFNKK